MNDRNLKDKIKWLLDYYSKLNPQKIHEYNKQLEEILDSIRENYLIEALDLLKDNDLFNKYGDKQKKLCSMVIKNLIGFFGLRRTWLPVKDNILKAAIPLLDDDIKILWTLSVLGIHCATEWFSLDYNKETFIKRHSPLSDPEFLDLIRYSSETDFPVLITGETGTGKELFANAIHLLSNRREQPFIPVNLGGLPSTLIESELFGHKEGAFTGAIRNRDGYCKKVGAGTLFLDEIGDMPIDAQVKLLRILNDNKFIPIGGDPSKPLKFEGRVICATNQDIRSLISLHRFREDLYYRISIIELKLPPLRKVLKEMPFEDKDLFFRSYFDNIAYELSFKYSRLMEDTVKKLMNYTYPGNYRELTNIMKRAFRKMRRGKIYEDAIIFSNISASSKLELNETEIDVHSLSYESLKIKIEEIEKNLLGKKIKALIEKHKGILKYAAEESGFGKGKNTITKFNKEAKKYGIDWKDYRQP